MLAVVGVAAIGTVIYVLAQSRVFASFPRTRLYSRSPQAVSAAAVAAIEKLKLRISYMDEQVISFSTPLIVSGEYAVAMSAAPVVHVIILPAEDGGTRLEVTGARSPLHYGWHARAQLFLKELDSLLS